jgi:hypothetical protein
VEEEEGEVAAVAVGWEAAGAMAALAAGLVAVTVAWGGLRGVMEGEGPEEDLVAVGGSAAAGLGAGEKEGEVVKEAVEELVAVVVADRPNIDSGQRFADSWSNTAQAREQCRHSPSAKKGSN